MKQNITNLTKRLIFAVLDV